jgi:hypothetical protein
MTPLNVVAPTITSANVNETTQCAVSPLVLTGTFGLNPTYPTIAFSTDTQCALASLMLRSAATLSNNGQACVFTMTVLVINTKLSHFDMVY